MSEIFPLTNEMKGLVEQDWNGVPTSSMTVIERKLMAEIAALQKLVMKLAEMTEQIDHNHWVDVLDTDEVTTHPLEYWINQAKKELGMED